jgi:uncharacterized protein (DUF433 family)
MHYVPSTVDKEWSMKQFERITQQPGVMGGKACIRGMRVTVDLVIGLIGTGRSADSILADYPYLQKEDLAEALQFARWRADVKEASLA